MTRLLAVLPVLLLAGCQTLGFYAQAVGGQVEIWRERQPVERLLADPAVAPALRDRLGQVKAIRDFASQELGLPDNGSYRSYADLGRPYVVWNVFATPELSLQPRQWCFLFAGCVAYRGYFGEADARQFAGEQRAQGDDVVVAGIPAYSTLGWFDDPVLNTFIGYPAAELARLIFHELSHQVVYVKDDSMFNESFAVAVELEGVERWLARNGSATQRDAWAAARTRKEQFFALVGRTRERLSALYDSPASDEAKRAGKAQALAELRADYAQLKERWGGFAGYDFWIAEPLNNAKLVPLATYSELVPGFQRLLRENGGDLPRFYAAVRALAKRPAVERRSLLAPG
jgi:predicted aminopeptidase